MIPNRKIIHVDLDAFHASVVQRDDLSLEDLTLAVGGSRECGVVAVASYEARAFRVRSAMPSRTALRLCPGLRFVPSRFERHREISVRIREVFLEHTPLVEPLSLDEAYLDVGGGPGLGERQASRPGASRKFVSTNVGA